MATAHSLAEERNLSGSRDVTSVDSAIGVWVCGIRGARYDVQTVRLSSVKNRKLQAAARPRELAAVLACCFYFCNDHSDWFPLSNPRRYSHTRGRVFNRREENQKHCRWLTQLEAVFSVYWRIHQPEHCRVPTLHELESAERLQLFRERSDKAFVMVFRAFSRFFFVFQTRGSFEWNCSGMLSNGDVNYARKARRHTPKVGISFECRAKRSST